jgi:hypothetical protein
MDHFLYDLVADTLPVMNTEVINGLAKAQTENLEVYIHDIFKCVAESFPKGLKYVDFKICTPEELFRESTRKTPRTFELQQSDVFLVKYFLTFNDGEKTTQLRPLYIYLPFIGEGGLLRLNGTIYQLTPVIGGKVFNVEGGNIYMPIPRQRLGFKPMAVSCLKTTNEYESQIVNENGVYSIIHNGRGKNKKSTLNSLLIHYILCKYGLTETMRRIFNTDILLGKQELDKLDPKEYIIYSSRNLINFRKGQQNEIRIAIKHTAYFKQLDALLASVFYIMDNATEATQTVADLNAPALWVFLLDRFIFKGGSGPKAYDEMLKHVNSVESYMDSITKKNLLNNDIPCKDIYELFRYVCLNYQDLNIHHGDGTMYYKELSTTKHLLYNIVHNIFSTMYAILLLPEHLLTVKKIENILMKTHTGHRKFSTKGHGELAPMSNGVASDCALYALSGNVISHNKAITTGGKTRNSKATEDQVLGLHPSQVEAGTYYWITTPSPTGRNKLNPFATFDLNWTITPNPKLKPTIERLTNILRTI